MASTTVYFFTSLSRTQSRSIYLAKQNATMEPRLSPTNTARDANVTPNPTPTADPKTNPLPNVNKLPGTKQMVAMKYTPMKANTPAARLTSIHSKKLCNQ